MWEFISNYNRNDGWILFAIGASLCTIWGQILQGLEYIALQQKYWKDQRITLKVSSIPSDYPVYSVIGSKGSEMTLQARADDLFGSSYAEKYLKDYNAQAYWASVTYILFYRTGISGLLGLM